MLNDTVNCILTLDLATKLGWAMWRRGKGVKCGSKQLPKTGDDIGAYIGAYRGWLRPVLRDLVRPDVVVFELPWIGVRFDPKTKKHTLTCNQTTMRKLVGLSNMTELVWKDLGKDAGNCWEANNMAMRAHFIGGRPGDKRADLKTKVIEACKARGWKPKDDDEADALGILDYAMHKLRIDEAIPGPLFVSKPGEQTILAAG